MGKITLKPQEGPQMDFLSTKAQIAIYGGSAGGGKTWALMVDPLRHIANKDFRFSLFRRTYPEITGEGALWDAAHDLYGAIGARPNEQKLSWTFPSGMHGGFSHMQHKNDRFRYKTAEIPWIGFDQLEMFEMEQFFYMMSRNRSTSGVKSVMRGTVNPDASSFVYDLVAWYLDNDGFPIKERSGEIRYFVRDGDDLRWADDAKTLETLIPDSKPKSFTFIPSLVTDNKVLMESDPDYIGNLKNLPKEEMEQLLMGRWVALSEGVTFPEFDRTAETAMVKKGRLPPRYHGIVGVDPGFFPDPTGALWGYYDFERDVLVILAEFFKDNQKTSDLAGEFKAIERRVFFHDNNFRPETIHRWSDIEKRLIADLTQDYDYQIYLSAKDDKDAYINRLRVRLSERRLEIDPACVNLVRQLRRCQKNTSGKSWIRTQTEGHFDLIDALLFVERNLDKRNPYPPDYANFHNKKYPENYGTIATGFEEMDNIGIKGWE